MGVKGACGTFVTHSFVVQVVPRRAHGAVDDGGLAVPIGRGACGACAAVLACARFLQIPPSRALLAPEAPCSSCAIRALRARGALSALHSSFRYLRVWGALDRVQNGARDRSPHLAVGLYGAVIRTSGFEVCAARAEMTAKATRAAGVPPVVGDTLALGRRLARTHTTFEPRLVLVFSGRAGEIGFPVLGVAFTPRMD